LRIFYKTVTACAHRIIVLEKELEERLSLLANPDKIAFVPIAIPTVRLPKKEYAKSKLNLPKDVFVILFFGFVTWYKGVDWLLRAFKKGRKIKLIIAGGMSPTLKNKPHYQVFYHKVLALAKKKGARITGFVDESDILLYFAAADLVIFPYRVFMSSSGPLAWTIAAKKPFILSSRLAPYFKSYDFQKASMLTYVKKEDLFFDFTSDKLQKKISFLLKNKNQLAKLESFSAKLAKMRSPKFLACRYLEQLEYDTNNSYGFIPILAKLLPRKLAYRLG
jgi:glycosyltransferase involved in cell wall biosynthesis